MIIYESTCILFYTTSVHVMGIYFSRRSSVINVIIFVPFSLILQLFRLCSSHQLIVIEPPVPSIGQWVLIQGVHNILMYIWRELLMDGWLLDSLLINQWLVNIWYNIYRIAENFWGSYIWWICHFDSHSIAKIKIRHSEPLCACSATNLLMTKI